MKKQKKLTAFERDQIALYHTQGISSSQIAQRLGREVSTIGRELSSETTGEKHISPFMRNSKRVIERYALPIANNHSK